MKINKPGRPKSAIERKPINTKLDPDVIKILKETSERTGIPQNRLIEDAVREKYGSEQGEDEP
jgi:hypothetical protein